MKNFERFLDLIYEQTQSTINFHSTDSEFACLKGLNQKFALIITRNWISCLYNSTFTDIQDVPH